MHDNGNGENAAIQVIAIALFLFAWWILFTGVP